MESVQKVCLIFTIIGAINWGLIGFFDFNLVEALFQDNTTLSRIVYSLVGICGLINIGLLFDHITHDPDRK
ncbi:MAG: DUF378 domain-containing protein [Bacilli bacterium]|nr:DUF378 domain-containing protein [Bacilli bacterium]